VWSWRCWKQRDSWWLDSRYGSVGSYGRDIGHWEYDMKRSTNIVWCIMVKSHNWRSTYYNSALGTNSRFTHTIQSWTFQVQFWKCITICQFCNGRKSSGTEETWKYPWAFLVEHEWKIGGMKYACTNKHHS
jgi:hypothetical protein